MSTIVITPPSIEPLSLEEARLQCRIDDTVQDALLQIYLQSARKRVEHHTGRSLMLQTRQATLDAFPKAIKLEGAPVIDVLSITYTATDGVDVVLDPADYKVDLYSTPPWIVPAYNTSWPDTLCTINAVRVVYRCGYSTSTDPATARAAVPADAKNWMLHDIARSHAYASGSSDKPTRENDFMIGLLDDLTIHGL